MKSLAESPKKSGKDIMYNFFCSLINFSNIKYFISCYEISVVERMTNDKNVITNNFNLKL